MASEEPYKSWWKPSGPVPEEWAKVRGVKFEDGHQGQPWYGLLPGDGPAGDARKTIDLGMRKQIIKYGELAQACATGFQGDEGQAGYGQARWDEDDFLRECFWIGKEKENDAPPPRQLWDKYAEGQNAQRVTYIYGASFQYAKWGPFGWYFTAKDAINRILKTDASKSKHKLAEDYGIDLPPDEMEKLRLKAEQEDRERHMNKQLKKEGKPLDFTSNPAFIGYIACAKIDDEKLGTTGYDVVVGTRGTLLLSEWLIDAHAYTLSPCEDVEGDFRVINNLVDENKNPVHVQIHPGFRDMYTTKVEQGRKSGLPGKDDHPKASPQHVIRQRLIELVQGGVLDAPVKSITFVGHSLGGALAIMAATDIGMMRYEGKYTYKLEKDPDQLQEDPPKEITITLNYDKWKDISLVAHTYAAPRVANVALRHQHLYTGVRVLNVVNVRDIVPAVPVAAIAYLTAGLGTFCAMVSRLLPFKKLDTQRASTASTFPYTLLPAKHYANAGVRLLIDSRQCKLLRPLFLYTLNSVFVRHNLEVYLYLVATQHVDKDNTDKDKRDPGLYRDFALLNKNNDTLKKSLAHGFHIPPHWWNPTDNTGMDLVGRKVERTVYRKGKEDTKEEEDVACWRWKLATKGGVAIKGDATALGEKKQAEGSQ